MAHYYDHHHESHNQAQSLANRFTRETRHSEYPTQYIVNEGKMTVYERSLKQSNAIIYNAPGSTLRFVPSRSPTNAKAKHDSNRPPESYWRTTAPPIYMCHGCRRRQIYYGAYCHDCTALRSTGALKKKNKQQTKEHRHDLRLTWAPDDKLIEWH
ncbi:uncharacterized protein F4812DRAFT_440958 [Daldinia caldariorum]|uniref:uncharacterized protein n=1 Tax=Daldinia caldariorum TaxID=326644 RepID=UPI002007A05C|nr:uncharacterized protein F4812DRAFT_440958 [Daldinia caldariorum]KAI1464920.1 hypothetical protein F4812DRAFT_440958 [Daldinia caldariorum]